jgi:ketosteroid isomerase-like protein
MTDDALAERMERVISDYFEACKNADAETISACFCPDGVHYFPHREPLRGAKAIGSHIAQARRLLHYRPVRRRCPAESRGSGMDQTLQPAR